MTEAENIAGPAQEIRNQYEATLVARQEYRRYVGSRFERTAHEQLHEAVFNLYEVLRPLIKDANATEAIWEEKELWPVGREVVEASVCPACEYIGERRSAENGKTCPRCGQSKMALDEVPAVDDHGQPVYKWKCGLSTLDGLRNQTHVVEESYNNSLGSYEGERVERDLLEPDHLIRVADLLDEAMQKLDLLVSFDDDLPKGQVSGVSGE